MLRHLPHTGVVAEIGTLRGDFARTIMAVAQPRNLHLIDIDFSGLDPRGLDEPSVTRGVGLSHEVIASYAANTFDWIYIDADHAYDAVLRDARASNAPLKPGGYLIFNDFCHIDPYLGRYGVKRAATDFILETGWPVAFLALQGDGLYDLAIRKPEAQR
ncbi:MAG: class I SAM-dependent methyltransferase [Hyphomicrobium sp.]